MHGSCNLKWAQTQLCRRSGYGVDLFLVLYNRVLSYRSVKPAQKRREGYIFRNLSLWSLVCYWGLECWHTSFLCILHDRHFVRIAFDSIQRNNQYIGPLPHPLPSLACGTAGPIWLHAITSNYSTCKSYNFFIFCTIFLKFPHKFLHTHSFILTIIKHNWKIRRFWVVDPLDINNSHIYLQFQIRNKTVEIPIILNKLLWYKSLLKQLFYIDRTNRKRRFFSGLLFCHVGKKQLTPNLNVTILNKNSHYDNLARLWKLKLRFI